jgi:hypothetical protein
MSKEEEKNKELIHILIQGEIFNALPFEKY